MSRGLEALEIREVAGGVEFGVKVVPGASRTKTAGIWGNAVKIAVSAPPEGGKANAALIRLLAGVLGVKRADVTIISGHARPTKRIAARGLTAAVARERLRAC